MRRSHGRIASFLPTALATIGLLAVLALLAVRAPTVSAETSDSYPHDATITSLQDCVQHAADAGFIDNKWIAKSLLSELDAAQAALTNGQPDVAISLIQAFSQEVRAQRGIHIQAEHADHLLMHANMVLEAMGGN